MSWWCPGEASRLFRQGQGEFFDELTNPVDPAQALSPFEALAVLWCERLPHGAGWVVHAQALAHAREMADAPREALVALKRMLDPVLSEPLPLRLPLKPAPTMLG